MNKKRGSCCWLPLFLFFYDMNFQIIKIDRIYEIVLIKTGFVMFFEFCYCRFQPDRFAQIELITNLLQRMEYFMCSCIVTVIADHCVLQHSVVLKFFSPQSEHRLILSWSVFETCSEPAGYPSAEINFDYNIILGDLQLRLANHCLVNRQTCSIMLSLQEVREHEKSVNCSGYAE